jgi:hypothetical protein
MGVLCFHGHSLRPKPFIVEQTVFSIFKICPGKYSYLLGDLFGLLPKLELRDRRHSRKLIRVILLLRRLITNL